MAVKAAGRFSEIDHLKAIGILVVILIHSVRAPWDPGISQIESWIGLATRFAVPGFLLCSGFLYATTARIPRTIVLRRLRRVLLPYLIVSLAAQLWWVSQGEGHALSEVVEEMLLGSSFGPYYYVFVHFWLVLFAPLFAVLPRKALWGLTAAMLVSQGVLESGTSLIVPIFWHVRLPMLWWGYFLLGWMLRLHYEPIRAFVTKHRGVLIGAALVAVVLFGVLMTGKPRTPFVRSAMWLDTWSILTLVFVVACGRGEPSRPIRFLADAGFAIYLLHLFFVYAAEGFIQPARGEFDFFVIGSYWCAGLFGALGVIGAVRTALGTRSRDVIGA